MADRSVRVRLSAEVGDYVSKMGQAASSTDKVAKSAEQAGKASKQHGASASEGWSTLASGATKAGAVVAVAGGSMVKAYMDFDAQMSKVGAATNASAGDLGKLRKAAMDAGKEFGQFTSTDAAGALEELGKAGLTSSESITALSGTMGLAASDGMEVAQAAELTADALNMFGLKGDQATRVADRLAQGAGAASGSAKQLGQGLSQVGAVANQMGVPMDDAVQSLSLFAKNGIKGSDAGTSLKTMLMSLANPSKEAAGTMKDLGIQAFDSQGKFVGMRDLAGQLNTKLAGLTTEQKNAALATMFGADAMRVAGVMAKEGTSGYDAMGKSMAGFGSASEIAAKKTANLKGRFAELGGAWENFGIQMGAAADGPLTKAVGGLTSMLELASRHPVAAQQIGMAVAALAAVGVAGAGVVKTVQGVQAFTGALRAIGLIRGASNVSAVADAAGSLGGKAGAVRGVSGALGGIAPVAIAAGVAVAGIAIARHFNSQNTAAIDATRTSIDQLNGAAQAAAAGSTSYGAAVNSAFAGTGAVLEEVGGALNELKYAQDSNLTSANEWIHSTLGMKTSSQALTEQMGKLDQSMASLDAGTAAAQMQQVSAANAEAGLSTDKLVALFPQYSQKLRDSAAAMGVTSLSAQELEGWMGGALPASVRKQAEAAAASGGANAAAARALLQSATAAQKTTAAVNAMPTGKKLDIIINTAKGATDIASLSKAIEALPPQKRTQILAIAKKEGLDAAKKALDALKDKKVTVNTKGDPAGAQKVEKAVKAVPGSKTAKVGSTGDPAGAQRVTTAVKAVPDSKTAKVSSTGNTAGADRVKGAVVAVPSSKVATVSTVGLTGGAVAARQAVYAVPASRTSTITTIFRQIMQKIGFATGGYARGFVRGPGTGTSDSIDAKLSNGEFVMRERAVRALGVARMDYINRTGQLPAFATGGLVGGVQRFATGGIVSGDASADQAAVRSWVLMAYDPTAYQQLGAAMKQLAAATANNTKAQQSNAQPLALAAAAKQRLTQAKDAKAALSATRQVEDAQYAASIAAAQAKAGGSARAATEAKVAALRAKANQVDLTYRTKLLAAQQAHNAKLIAQITAARKQADLSFDKQIAAAKAVASRDSKASAPQKAAAQAEVRRLQAAKKANDLRQAREMAAATAAVTAASKANDTAQRQAAAAAKVAKKSAEDLAVAHEALRQRQQELADAARQIAEGFRAQVEMGSSFTEWNQSMRMGGHELLQFTKHLGMLRNAGLSESLIQQLVSKGTKDGDAMARSILGQGPKAVDSLNKAAKNLEYVSGQMGKFAAVGVVKRSTGGAVWGAGTATSDSIPALLSNGEHVWTSREVDALGGHDAMLRLRAAVLGGGAPRYAIGGQVAGFSQSLPRYVPQQRMVEQSTQLTWAPQMQISGPDAREVASHAISRMRHEARTMSVQLPGA